MKANSANHSNGSPSRNVSVTKSNSADGCGSISSSIATSIGDASAAAEVEIVALAIDLLRAFGFTANDVVVRLSDREFWTDLLRQLEVPADQWSELLQVIDKSERESRETDSWTARRAGRTGFRSSRRRRTKRKTGSTRPATRRPRTGRLRQNRSHNCPRTRLLHRSSLRSLSIVPENCAPLRVADVMTISFPNSAMAPSPSRRSGLRWAMSSWAI